MGLFIAELFTLVWLVAGIVYLWRLRGELLQRYPDIIALASWPQRALIILGVTYGLATLLFYASL